MSDHADREQELAAIITRQRVMCQACGGIASPGDWGGKGQCPECGGKGKVLPADIARLVEMVREGRDGR